MNFECAPEFQKELKQLAKKWRSLPRDIEYVKPRIASLYTEHDDIDIATYRAAMFSGKRATILKVTETCEVIKMRLDVEALGSNSKVRIVFVAVKSAGLITFIELYAKNDKSREDQKRIDHYLS